MDPLSLYTQPPNGLPQGSKLVTSWLNRPVTQPQGVVHNVSRLSLAGPVIQSSSHENYQGPSTSMQTVAHDMTRLAFRGPASHNRLGKDVVPVDEVDIIRYQVADQLTSGSMPEEPHPALPPRMPQVRQANYNGTTYFFHATAGGAEPANDGQDLGYEEEGAAGYDHQQMRVEMQGRNQHAFVMNAMQYQDANLPKSVDAYTDLVSLEPPGPAARTYTATNTANGQIEVLRRFPSYVVPNATRQLEQWMKLPLHPNVARLTNYFACTQFGDHSMVLVYECHTGSETLLSKYLMGSDGPLHFVPAVYDPFSEDPSAPRPYTHQKNAILRAVAREGFVSETDLWNILIQVTCGLRFIHSAGLAMRNLDCSKVIVAGVRYRISFGGTGDVLTGNSGSSSQADIIKAQQDDLTALGTVMLSLGCRTVYAPHQENISVALQGVQRLYGEDMKNVIVYLMSPSPDRSLDGLMPLIGVRYYNQIQHLEHRVDGVERQFSEELDCERMFMMLVKMMSILERPELNMNLNWSETGGRYMLKLFRDYVFHAQTADGRPVMDLSHIVYCLNQLDAGTDEYVSLMSRDEESVLVVSYAELKSCFDAAFNELLRASDGEPPA